MEIRVMDRIVELEQTVPVLNAIIMFVEKQILILKVQIFLKMDKTVLLILIVNQTFVFITYAMDIKKIKNFVFKIMTVKVFYAIIKYALKLNLNNKHYKQDNFVKTIVNVNQNLAYLEYAMEISQMDQNATVTIIAQVNFAISTNVLQIMIR